MKHSLTIFIISALLASAPAAGQNTLTLTLTNIKPGKGHLIIGLFNKEEGFLKPGRQYLQKKINAHKTQQQYMFENLPSGSYSLAVYQDENGNGTCDTNILGIPTEGYGFSNNIRPKFSAPSFSQTKISVKGHAAATIRLIK